MKKVGKPRGFYTSRGRTARVNKWRTKLESLCVPHPAALSLGARLHDIVSRKQV